VPPVFVTSVVGLVWPGSKNSVDALYWFENCGIVGFVEVAIAAPSPTYT
jgi:hypothetical protein